MAFEPLTPSTSPQRTCSSEAASPPSQHVSVAGRSPNVQTPSGALQRGHRLVSAGLWTLGGMLMFGSLNLLVGGCKFSDGVDDDDLVSPTPVPEYSPTPEVEPTPPPVEILIAAEPNALRFTSTEVSESSTLAVYFRNAGTKTYTIQELQLTQTFPAYSRMWIKDDPCDPDPTVLKPNGSLGVMVTFRPAQPGNFKGALTLITGEDNPTVSITGTGVAYDPTDDTATPVPTALPECP